MMARYRPSGVRRMKAGRTTASRRHRDAEGAAREIGLPAEERNGDPRVVEIPVPLHRHDGVLLEGAQHGERRPEAVVDWNLGHARPLVHPPPHTLHARKDVRNEHDVDRLVHLREHEPADLPVAEVRRQKEHSAAARPPLHDVREPHDAFDQTRRLRRGARREVEEVEPRRGVAPHHPIRGLRHAGRVRRLARDPGDVSADGGEVLRAQPEITAADRAREGIRDRPRHVSREEESAGKPEVGRRGPERPHEPIPAGHLLLHGPGI